MFFIKHRVLQQKRCIRRKELIITQLFFEHSIFSEILILRGGLGPHSVSYTHLDVYKRQERERERESECVLGGGEERNVEKLFYVMNA